MLQRDGSVTLALPVNFESPGNSTAATLRPHSFRGEGFRLRVHRGRRGLHDVVAPPPSTFRGELPEFPGSSIVASIHGDRIRAVMQDRHDRWFVEPAAKGRHCVIRGRDAKFDGTACSTPSDDHQPPIEAADEEDPANGCPVTIEIAFDADYEFFVANGASIDATVEDIESIVAGVDFIYSRELGLRFVITEIVVRTTPDDPYDEVFPPALLAQFRAVWSGELHDVARDVAHLMTGKDLTGPTVGIAAVGACCVTEAAFGISQSNYSDDFARRVVVTAHEIAHNLGATHCDGSAGCGIMCATLGGCTGETEAFGPISVAQIRRFVRRATCLGIAGPSFVEAGATPSCDAIEVRFGAAPSAVSYNIHRAAGSTDRADAETVATDALSPWIDWNVAPDITYAYWVTAVDAEGCEGPLQAFTLGALPGELPPPKFVAAADGGQCDHILVDWAPVPQAVGFEIWRSDSPDPDAAVHLADTTASPYADRTIVPGATYWYWVGAIDGCGKTGRFGSGDPGFTALAPATVMLAAGDDPMCPGVLLEWTSIAGATSYFVWRGTSRDAAAATRVADAETSPFVDTSATPGNTYFYWVQAINACAQGDLGDGVVGVGNQGRAADVNRDCAVDGRDLGALLDNWGPADSGASADLNADGVVDGADLDLFMTEWIE